MYCVSSFIRVGTFPSEVFFHFLLGAFVPLHTLFTSTIRLPFPPHPPPTFTSSIAEPSSGYPPALPPLLPLSQPITAACVITWLTEEQEDGIEWKPYTAQTDTAATRPSNKYRYTHTDTLWHIDSDTHIDTHSGSRRAGVQRAGLHL